MIYFITIKDLILFTGLVTSESEGNVDLEVGAGKLTILNQ